MEEGGKHAEIRKPSDDMVEATYQVKFAYFSPLTPNQSISDGSDKFREIMLSLTAFSLQSFVIILSPIQASRVFLDPLSFLSITT